MTRQAIGSVLVQASGSAATAAAAVLVASQLGLAAQGEFGLLRSWSDVLVMAAAFGLPQGLLHLQYREGVSAAALRPWIARYVGGLALLALALVALGAFAPLPGALPQRAQALVLVAAAPLAAGHLLWRSLALHGAGPLPFAVLTAAPALLILAGLLPFALFGWHGGFEWVLLSAAAVSALASYLLARRVAGPSAPSAWSRRRLGSVSLHSGTQALLTTLSPAALLSLASLLGAPLAQIGLVSLGMQLYQLFAVAAVYAAPLVYDRAARGEAGQVLDGQRLLAALRRRAALPLFVAAAAAGLGLPWLVAALWPPASGLAPLFSLMAAAGLIALAVRLLSTLQQARGAYALLSRQALVRLVVGTGLAALLMQRWPATLAVPAAMLAVEALLLVWLLATMRRAQ